MENESAAARIVRTVVPLYGKAEKARTFIDEGLYGQECRILEKENGFSYVRMEYGYCGWIEDEALTEGLWDRKYDLKRVIWHYIDVMDRPQVDSLILESVTMGGILAMAEEEKQQELPAGWCCVYLADGRCGYTKISYLIPLRELKFSAEGLDEKVFRGEVTEMAQRYRGVHYRWAGKSPLGIDCSGMCSMAYLMCGVAIFRDALIDPEYCVKEIQPEDIQPGDLLYFKGHIGMYLGGERRLYLHSTAHAGDDGVVYNSLNPEDPRYREDLAKGILHVGSIFA